MKFVPVILEFKIVTLPLHWIILKMDIISHFNFIFLLLIFSFYVGVIWKPLLQRVSDRQSHWVKIFCFLCSRKCFLMDIQWQIFLRFNTEVKSQREHLPYLIVKYVKYTISILTYVLLSTKTNFISYFSKCRINAWWRSTGPKHVEFTDETNKIWWLTLTGLWLLICYTTGGWMKQKITTEILFQSQHNSCGICVGQSGIRIGFVQEFHISSPPYSSLTRGCYGRPILGHSKR